MKMINQNSLLLMLYIVRERGIDVSKVCHSAGVSLEQLEKQIFVLNETNAEELIKQSVEHSGIGNLGFLVGMRYQLKMLGLLGQLLQYGGTMRGVLKIAMQFISLVTKVVRIEYEEYGQRLTIRVIPNETYLREFPYRAKHVTLVVLGVVLRINEELVLKERLDLSNEINIELPLFVSDLRNIETEYNGKFSIGKSNMAVINANTALLDWKTMNTDSVVLSHLVKVANERKGSAETYWSDKVKETLLRNFDSNVLLKIEDVADLFHIARRTLQRRLSKEKTSYIEIVEEIKFEMAQYYLTTNKSIKETAILVGFSTVSNFTRSFTTWSGMTPGEFLTRHGIN